MQTHKLPGIPPSDWTGLLATSSTKPEQSAFGKFSAALTVVAEAAGQGRINNQEADLLIRHLAAALIASEFSELFAGFFLSFSGLSGSDPSGYRNGNDFDRDFQFAMAGYVREFGN